MWAYLWNQPGCLPDFCSGDDSESLDWEAARDALIWEVERWDEDDGMSAEQMDAAVAALRALAPNEEAAVPCGALVLCIVPFAG